jgi:hypothetical protein
MTRFYHRHHAQQHVRLSAPWKESEAMPSSLQSRADATTDQQRWSDDAD